MTSAPSPSHTDVPLAVVVAYGAPELAAHCLRSFGAGERLVVVDNGLDDTVSAVAIEVGARYLRPPGNVGFAAAVNMALAEVRQPGQDVLLLNPDATVSAVQAAALVRSLRRPGWERVAAVGPALRHADGANQRTTWPMPTPSRVWLGACGLGEWRVRHTFLSGAVLLLRGAAVDEVGMLDERFFLYAEETDWQRRALDAGWQLRVATDVVVEHAGGATSTDERHRLLLAHASAEAYFRKWFGGLGWTFARSGAVLSAARRSLTGPGEQRYVAGLYVRGPMRAAARARSRP